MTCKKVAEIHSVGYRNTPSAWNYETKPLGSEIDPDLYFWDWTTDCPSRINYQITPVCKRVVKLYQRHMPKAQFATEWFNLNHVC